MLKTHLVQLLLISTFLNASDTNLLSLQEAIEVLKSENLEIKSASIGVNSAKLDIDIANGSQWGKLDFIQDVANSDDASNVFGFRLTSREVKPQDLAVDTLNYPDSRSFFQSKLKYELPLFTGFKISSYIEISKSMAFIKSLDKDKVINEKIYQLKKSYSDMALLNDSSKNLSKILTNIEVLEKTTTTMIEVGYAKKVDLLEVQAKKGNIQRLLLQIESNKKLLLHYISFLLNKDITAIAVKDTNVLEPIYSNEKIVETNLDVKKATVGLEIKKKMIDISKSSYYPTLGAYGEVASADDKFLGDMNKHKTYTVGARFTWNILNAGIDSAKLEKSKLEHLKAQTQVNLAKQGVALKIAEIKTEIETFDEEIVSLNKELSLADEIYKNYEGRYKEKLSSMSTVLIKQSEQIEKILQLQKVKNKRNERIFALEKLANGEQI